MTRRTIRRAHGAADTVTDRVPEWRLQAEQCAGLDQLLDAAPHAFAYAASMEAGRRSRAERTMAKASGLRAGEPDIRLYFPGARLAFVENKAADGRLTKSQRERIPALAALGFPVHVIAAAEPQEARTAILALVAAYLAGDAPEPNWRDYMPAPRRADAR